MADKVNGYLAGAALGVPGILLYRVLHAYSSSVNQTRPIMLVSLAALALNVPLNYMLIHGLFGLPALGGAGCGWSYRHRVLVQLHRTGPVYPLQPRL